MSPTKSNTVYLMSNTLGDPIQYYYNLFFKRNIENLKHNFCQIKKPTNIKFIGKCKFNNEYAF